MEYDIKQKILVTGCAGMIGTNLINDMLYCGFNVMGVDNLSGGYYENLPIQHKKFTFREMSVEDDSFEVAFKEFQPDYVFALHAYAAENLSPFIRRFNYRNNVESMANLINCCIKYKVKRIVFTSSIAVYGKQKPPFHELNTPQPADPYAIGKYATELDLKVAGEQHGLDYCILRPYNVYGEYQNIKDKYRNVLGIWINQVLNGEPMIIFGDGEQKRAFTYVGDIIKPIIKAAFEPTASKQIINLGSTRPWAITEACALLQVEVGKSKVKYVEERHETKMAYCINEKAKVILDYRDETSLEDGLRNFRFWVNESKAYLREPKPSPPIEVEQGLYKEWK